MHVNNRVKELEESNAEETSENKVSSGRHINKKVHNIQVIYLFIGIFASLAGNSKRLLPDCLRVQSFKGGMFLLISRSTSVDGLQSNAVAKRKITEQLTEIA